MATVLTTIQGAPIIIDAEAYDAEKYGDIICQNPSQRDVDGFDAAPKPAKRAAKKRPAKKA